MSGIIDLEPIVRPVLATAGTVIAALLAIYVPKAIDALQKWTGIILTDQQRATVLGAVQTAAGNIETKLDQSILQTAHVTIDNPAVQAEAASAIAAVPNAAAALNMTVDGVARMIIGKVDTAAHGAPAPINVETVLPLTVKGIAVAVVEELKLLPHNPPANPPAQGQHA